ncbi:MAG TPA: hypothetical protein VGC93_02495 [Thermoanaerobaculia bacterium]
MRARASRWSPRRSGAVLALAIAAVAAASPLDAERIGEAVVVRSLVEGQLGGEPPRQLVRGNPIENGLRVRLRRPDSLLRVAFFDGRLQSFDPSTQRIDGAFILRGVGEAVAGQRAAAAEGGVLHTLSVLFGELLYYLAPGRSAELETPHTTSLGLKGTVLRVLVDPVVGTFVGVDEGSVVVQAAAGGDPVLVGAGQWVLVPPGGLPTRPAPRGAGEDLLEDPPLLGCCPGTEPPKPPGRP